LNLAEPGFATLDMVYAQRLATKETSGLHQGIPLMHEDTQSPSAFLSS
jgi:hypothetical protein